MNLKQSNNKKNDIEIEIIYNSPKEGADCLLSKAIEMILPEETIKQYLNNKE
ncbi:MAG: hypothetical protein PHV78_01720 [Patescibacteria group bacterium]|nr:hypothetical protein [Patescibacteria group bacterium]MDD5121131.1 hypothetical protein [Patescibacteria group bacterium]MDD5221646.1 hypothetical protein [Patescibacteria group bacterium]MDD5395950.1 hypothetical protein [Patescibacteria group bacterium]